MCAQCMVTWSSQEILASSFRKADIPFNEEAVPVQEFSPNWTLAAPLTSLRDRSVQTKWHPIEGNLPNSFSPAPLHGNHYYFRCLQLPQSNFSGGEKKVSNNNKFRDLHNFKETMGTSFVKIFKKTGKPFSLFRFPYFVASFNGGTRGINIQGSMIIRF